MQENVSPEHATKVQNGSRNIPLLILKLEARDASAALPPAESSRLAPGAGLTRCKQHRAET